VGTTSERGVEIFYGLEKGLLHLITLQCLQRSADHMRLLTMVLGFAAITNTGSAFQMTPQPNPSTWVPLPADHWPQEPDGFNGMKFDATRSEIEKVIKLENCETAKYGNIGCKVTLDFAGRNLKGNILFLVPQDPKTNASVGQGRLGNIYAQFGKTDYSFVKAAFIKMYGQPHQIDTPASLDAKMRARMSPEEQMSIRPSVIRSQDQNGEFLTWQGNKTEIRLNVEGDDGTFVFSPNMRARGAIAMSTIEVLPVEEPPIPPIPIEKLAKTLRVKTTRGPVEFERGDLIDIGTLSYKFIQRGDEYEYSYAFDNTQVWLVGLGMDLEDQKLEDIVGEILEGMKNWTQPKDWQPFTFGWSQALYGRRKGNSVDFLPADPQFSKSARYSMLSKLRPGVIPMFFQSDTNHFREMVSKPINPPRSVVEAVPNQIDPTPNAPVDVRVMIAEEQAVSTAQSWRYNSLKKYVIGPAIKQDASQADIMALVRRWVEDYGFTFLSPLLTEGGNPRRLLNTLHPNEGLEQDIAECLRLLL
jgi:hypothetical protein